MRATCIFLIFGVLAVPGPKDGIEELALAPPPKLVSGNVNLDYLPPIEHNDGDAESMSEAKADSTNQTVSSAADVKTATHFVRFLGWPQAVTSETAHLIVEGTDPAKLPSTTLGTKQGVSSAQILYEKIKQSEAAPLVSVFLMEDQHEVYTLFKDKFDMVGQQCSCYWIDLKDVASKVSSLKASDKYYLRFLDTTNTPSKFDARSGLFTISP
ncbi:hypothetical protein DSO57_1034726 [Entomophthora muscae]|uniref:Uncharacterized protein n=1 Tax=Entomophthora muscae TaxID=34485 RepID=A0ACC2TLI0_9FUNG|nr:hypothetical protein DSO57_1034726 [Entomophthora muscae]